MVLCQSMVPVSPSAGEECSKLCCACHLHHHTRPGAVAHWSIRSQSQSPLSQVFAVQPVGLCPHGGAGLTVGLDDLRGLFQP